MYTSSAVLATTVRRSQTSASPRASFAPPVPPDSSTTESIAGSLPGGPMRLADRTALVTGGAPGNGAATGRRPAAGGARGGGTDGEPAGARGGGGGNGGGPLGARGRPTQAR